MDMTLEAFKAQQERAAGMLRDLLAFLQEGEDFGIAMDDAFAQKLKTAIGTVVGERLKVALVGGFSEGKTSIAAAWMNRLDRHGMNISQTESTDHVLEYPVGDDLLLVDTPGLFGSREVDGATYKDLTRKYVSEANLVLYVMDPTNPIKESHQAELEWLFRELGLLSRTVFVLSRFDAVADLEDETAYQAALEVKRRGVRQRLTDLLGLTASEVHDLSIVGVSANPFEQGIEYWLANPDQHRQLSRIQTLQVATESKVHASGGMQQLVADTKTAIIADVLGKQLPLVSERARVIKDEVGRLKDTVEELEGKLQLASQQANNAGNQIRRFLTGYFSDLILQARGADMQTWSAFFEREVGAEGIVINMRLQQEYAKCLQSVQLNLQAVQGNFVDEINHFNTVVSSMGQQGVKYLLDGKLVNNKSILMLRDGVVSAGKMVGFDLGKNLKFAPWGAHKLAGGVNGALAGVGFMMEVWDSYKEYEREQKFRQGVEDFVKTMEAQRASLVAELDAQAGGSVFTQTYFPALLEMRELQAALKANLDGASEKQDRFAAWHQRAGALEGEYQRLRAG